MYGNIKRVALAAATALALTACDSEVSSRDGDGDEEEGWTPATSENGVLLNSFRLNSFRLNSFRLNSFRLNGDQGSEDFIQIIGVDLPGSHAAKHSWIEGSELRVETQKGKLLTGHSLTGTTIRFAVQEDGVEHVREVKIAGVATADPKHGKHHKHGKHKGNKGGHDDAGTVLYDLRIRELPNQAWAPLCGADGDGDPIAAVLLSDTWDPDTGAKISPRPSDAVTLACVDAALGKCVVWGYAPWASVDGEPLADYHQAFTRLVRADNCGRGVSYNKDGTPIHVLDTIGIEDVDPVAKYVVEAEWGPDGAVCLNAGNTRIDDVEVACQELPACGESFASGGQIQSGKIVGEVQ
jgi:hypothetical protein